MEWYWQGKTGEFGKKPISMTICPPQIPHWMAAMKGRRTTTWNMIGSWGINGLCEYDVKVLPSQILSKIFKSIADFIILEWEFLTNKYYINLLIILTNERQTPG